VVFQKRRANPGQIDDIDNGWDYIKREPLPKVEDIASDGEEETVCRLLHMRVIARC
jgi:hypothetical protein